MSDARRDADLGRNVETFARRREEAARDDPRRALATAVRILGVGWLVVVPALLGFVVGRLLDRRFATGVTFAAAFGLLGVIVGCIGAWRHVRRAARS